MPMPALHKADLTPLFARHLQLPVKHGALVDTVSAGGPAAAAGLRGGTREEQFQGQTVTVGGDVIVCGERAAVADAADLVRIVTTRCVPARRRSLPSCGAPAAARSRSRSLPGRRVRLRRALGMEERP